MSKKKQKKDVKSSRIIKSVGGSYIEGNVDNSGEFIGRDKITSVDASVQMKSIFASIYPLITARPNTTDEQRNEIERHVQDIETEVSKGEKTEEGFLATRMRNLKRMAPDIWEVILSLLINPVTGLNTVASKIAKRIAKEPDLNDEH